LIFPTIEFAAFFVVVFVANWLLMPHPRVWKPFMLAASYFFYGYADARFVLLIVVSSIVNQVAAVWIYRLPRGRTRSWVLSGTVAVNLGLLGWFKYYGFFVDSVHGALEAVGLPAPLPLLQIALPVGISFFTFQALSYVIDVSRDVIKPAKFLDFAVYEAFFPHLVAGPIVRAREFIPQLASPRDPRRIPFTRASFLIVGGLVKKIVIADLLATRLVDPVFSEPGDHSSLEILTAIYGYAVQIYCDFSAYSEMAIGIALLLGFRFPDNFNRPYAAVTLQDFWRRWHMSLSNWLRDYLYVPLGGNRRGVRATYRNLMLTMLLGGLWHGAAWTFVVWGAIHGAGLAAERWLGERRGARDAAAAASGRPAGGDSPIGGGVSSLDPEPAGRPGGAAPVATAVRAGPTRPLAGAQLSVLPTVLRGLVTFHLVCLAWVFFRSPDLGTAFEMLGRLVLAPGPAPLVTGGVLLAIAVGLATQFVPPTLWLTAQREFSFLPIVWQGVLLGLALLVINAIVGEQGVAPFIYFRF
jgi:alginate O-acetyltransferase complex protein AlgI